MPRLSISSTKYYDVLTPTNVFKQNGNVFDFTSHQSCPFSGNPIKCKIRKFLLNYEISNKNCLIICHFNTCAETYNQ